MTPIVATCGDLLCDDCIITDKANCPIPNCGHKYIPDKFGVPEDLIELQPSMSLEGSHSNKNGLFPLPMDRPQMYIINNIIINIINNIKNMFISTAIKTLIITTLTIY